MNTQRSGLLLLVAALSVTACARAPQPAATHAAQSDIPQTEVAAQPQRLLPSVKVHKSATCGCCQLWVEHLERAGFTVEVHNSEDLNPIKERLGVPYGRGSCHTAEIDGYIVEGHVPVQDILRLLNERPAGRGLVLPGMPAGSPGMEMPDGRVQPYAVDLILPDGTTKPYALHGRRG
ncbi:DUF411 domain-containing protein [Stenotrophomonas acidaminiphila]|uniref:DUF411 domain-containing protein n=1 Tax=Stenotrophomonas acidaminiphila TaxID=128780 RepID=UPI0028A81E7B|nr:DUF411 domain-containing protein [Stenotrophomonas acidaminiphila]